jgi:hypothetical protein
MNNCSEIRISTSTPSSWAGFSEVSFEKIQ